VGVVSIKRGVIALSCLVVTAGLVSTVSGLVTWPERIHAVGGVEMGARHSPPRVGDGVGRPKRWGQPAGGESCPYSR